MASKITSLTIVYLTVYSRGRSKKTSKLRVTGLCEGISPVTSEFPAQSAINAENVSIWWRHHVHVTCAYRRRCSLPRMDKWSAMWRFAGFLRYTAYWTSFGVVVCELVWSWIWRNKSQREHQDSNVKQKHWWPHLAGTLLQLSHYFNAINNVVEMTTPAVSQTNTQILLSSVIKIAPRLFYTFQFHCWQSYNRIWFQVDWWILQGFYYSKHRLLPMDILFETVQKNYDNYVRLVCVLPENVQSTVVTDICARLWLATSAIS